MSKIELPPLANISPKDCIPYGSIRYIAGYSEEYVKQYARARDRQIVELCAALCDQYEMAKWEAYKHGHGPERASDYTQGQSDGAGDCGNAIRALLDEKKGNE